jgi:hypothetical protein
MGRWANPLLVAVDHLSYHQKKKKKKKKKILTSTYCGCPVESGRSQPSAPELQTLCRWVADRLRMNGRSSTDERQIIRWPNFSLTKCNSFNLHISSSWNVNWNLRFQLEWNMLWKLEFQCPFQHTWNARFQMHFFLYWNGKFRFTISVHLFCNLTPGISATFQLVQNLILFL